MTAALATELLGDPATRFIDSAACAGRWQLFDPGAEGEPFDTVRYRHQAAQRVCGTCPVLSECRSWIDSLPQEERPLGVIAGRVPHPAAGARR